MKRLILMLMALPIYATTSNWPAWRGPESNGSTPESKLPISWSATNQVRWRVELPEPGNSSPIIWKDRVFATQAVGQRRTLLCVDRKSGSVLWQAGPTYEFPETKIKDNPYCAASPVTDGRRIIAFFGSAGLYCYDFSGKEMWRADLGKIEHMFGPASSPCLDGDFCYVFVGPGETEGMVAVNKRTGKIAWRSETLKPNAAEAAKISTNGPPTGSWSTPLMINHHGRKELVMSFAFRYGAYDPRNGKLLWEQPGLGLQTYVTPLFTEGLLIPMGGNITKALQPQRTGEPTEVWTQTKSKFRFGAGVATADHLFYLTENGFAECWEKSSGKILWQERLQGPGKKMTSWSSLSMGGDAIYAPNQSGDVFVFAASPEFRMISTNSVAEPTNASLALGQGNVVMRTDRALWCFGS